MLILETVHPQSIIYKEQGDKKSNDNNIYKNYLIKKTNKQYIQELQLAHV